MWAPRGGDCSWTGDIPSALHSQRQTHSAQVIPTAERNWEGRLRTAAKDVAAESAAIAERNPCGLRVLRG